MSHYNLIKTCNKLNQPQRKQAAYMLMHEKLLILKVLFVEINVTL